MKWNKFRLTTTTEAEDIVSSMLMDLGIQGVEIEDKVPLTQSDKEQMFVDILPETEADSYDTKHSFQTFHSLFVIVFAFTVHIHSPLCFVYIKFSVHILQCKTDLTHQSVFKQIPVLSFDPDFSVFNQK